MSQTFSTVIHKASIACETEGGVVAKHRFGVSRKWSPSVRGRSIEKKTDACKAAGLPEPIIEENSGDVVVDLLKAPASEELGNHLGNSKDRILSEMKANPKISGVQLAEIFDISTTAVEKNITQLREDG
ncbi:MAG: winged helix-turn-helix transcriptional regulator [Spirochaetia bacterium]|nr:winged helix-turn-helix transcriptional regulator [Spirochaetia bacterium]